MGEFVKRENFDLFRRIICVLLIGITFLYWVSVCITNKHLEANFISNQKGNVYEQQEELTLENIRKINRSFEQRISLYKDEKHYYMESNVDLHYYRDEECKELAKTISKGTKIVVWLYAGEVYGKLADTLFYYYCYGTLTYPTYQRGVRVSIPFLTEEEVMAQEVPEYELLYISKNEMDQLYKKLAEEYPLLYEDARGQDDRLYKTGNYISPDLYGEYFPFWIKFVLLVIVGNLFYGIRKRAMVK